MTQTLAQNAATLKVTRLFHYQKFDPEWLRMAILDNKVFFSNPDNATIRGIVAHAFIYQLRTSLNSERAILNGCVVAKVICQRNRLRIYAEIRPVLSHLLAGFQS
jgi:hypothetical protein